ncbi:hypothetical protein [Vulgatibacter sp.]|uniref:hypothetical protein n=1 Tax=Vulgatibacter sp. TaxID=1971226 RepID=UPI003569F378
MARKDDERNDPTGPFAGGGSGGRPGYTRGEMPVVTDAQLGVENLDRGPETANPEGSVDISNVDYHRVEGDLHGRRRVPGGRRQGRD